MAAALATSGCATEGGTYPGVRDVRHGASPVIRIERTASTETDPRELRVPAGTEVIWRNESGEPVFIRFNQVVQACGEPVGFHPTYDGASLVSEWLHPFGEGRLCLDRPGHYDFVVSAPGQGGGALDPGGDGASSPVRYGRVVVD
jgi:hypothetical protein